MTLGDLMVFERQRWSSRHWGKRLLKVTAMIVAVAVSVVLAIMGYFTQPSVIWLALLGILYAAPGVGAGIMAREWKEDTWYWWLSLPASREKLLAAKFLSALGRWVKIWLTLFAYMCIYIAILDATLGPWSWNTFLGQIQFGWQVGILTIVEVPLLVTIGLWMGALPRTDKSKYLLAPMWGIIVLIINTQLTGLSFTGVGQQMHPEIVLNYEWLAIKFAAAYSIAAAGLFSLARWLKLQK